VPIRPAMAGTVRGFLTSSCHWAAEADKRQQALLLPIKGDKAGTLERRLRLSEDGLNIPLRPSARGLAVKHLDLVPRNPVMCRELYR
jgi:hypothetical protein